MVSLFDAHFHIAGKTGEIPSAGICCSADDSEWPAVIALSRRAEGVLPCLGIHPWNVSGKNTEILARLRQKISETGAFIGETGLDSLRPDMDLQEIFFAEHLRISAGLGRPAIIHCVRAWGRIVRIIRECRPGKFMVHSFSGSKEIMKELLYMGGWFSFGPKMAFSHEKKHRLAFLHVPDDRFMLESEGGISQQEGLARAAEAAARIKNMPFGAIIRASNANYTEFIS